MNDNIITTERAGNTGDVVQINLGHGAELPTSLPFLEKFFRDCFKKNDVRMVIDMRNIKLPPTRFIALLIEITNQARRLGGSVQLKNVADSVRNNFVTFSPITYLTIEDSEDFALFDFGEKDCAPPVITVKNSGIKVMPVAPQQKSEDQPVIVATKEIQSPEQYAVIDKIRVVSSVKNLYEICDFVIAHAEKAGFDNKENSKIKVTVYEACLNVVEHAYFSHSDDNWIEVEVGYNEQKFTIKIRDWGQGFDFKPSKNYDVEKAVKERKTGGFGLHIIQRSVDEIAYEADPVLGNTLTLVKYIRK